MLAYLESSTWSSLPPQPWGHGHVLFYETNATHAFTHLLITFTRVHFFGNRFPALVVECIAFSSDVNLLIHAPALNHCFFL